jgi:transposase
MKAVGVQVKELDFGVVREALAAARQTLAPEHYEPLGQVVEGYGNVLELLRAKNASIRKLRDMIFGASTERLRNLTGKALGQAAGREKKKPRNHGRNGAEAYPGAEQIVLRHPTLKHGDECPDCKRAKLYENKRHLVLVRFFGQPPIKAKAFRRPPLRCAGCGKTFSAELPAEAQGDKYDASAVAIIALEKYGQGKGFNRLEKFQASLGVPVPAATQWDLVNERAEDLSPAYEELLRQAAASDLFHNDDTPNRVLELDEKREGAKKGEPSGQAAAPPADPSTQAGAPSSSVQAVAPAEAAPPALSALPAQNPPSMDNAALAAAPGTVAARPAPHGASDPGQGPGPVVPAEQPQSTQAPKKKKAKRTGQYTSSIVAVLAGRVFGLFFTGRKHAGENLGEVLKRRAATLGLPLQMCDGLARNLPAEFKTILGNCLAHGRRRFYDLFAYWPEECRHVLEVLAAVYRTDARAKELGLSAEERLRLHQAESGPIMARLKSWMEDQFEERRVEPNSRLGNAIKYCLKRWEKLTLFLHKPGAPLDNNIAERALKMAIRHRKNSLFFKTLRGAAVADLFMSLIHTCQLNAVNPFEYLVALSRHPVELKACPADWMPWTYRDTLARLAPAPGHTIEKPDSGTG